MVFGIEVSLTLPGIPSGAASVAFSVLTLIAHLEAFEIVAYLLL